jgi:uncharacterized membrane protein
MENNKKEKTNNQITAYDVEMKKLEMLEKKELENKQFKARNKYKIIGLLLAFLTVSSFIDFGFFKTIGIWIVMLIGYGLGARFDRDPKFIRFMARLSRKFK